MKRESDRKCVNHARGHASAQSFDRCEVSLSTRVTSSTLLKTAAESAVGSVRAEKGRATYKRPGSVAGSEFRSN